MNYDTMRRVKTHCPVARTTGTALTIRSNQERRMATSQLTSRSFLRPDGKHCYRCKMWLPLTKFGRNKALQDGLQERCKSCHSAVVKEYYHAHPETKAATIAKAAAWHKANPERVNLAQLRYRLKLKGVSLEQYTEALARQKDACGICGSKEVNHSLQTRLVVDHDHVTGRFRGLLCHNCNVSLGLMRDDIAVLERAIAYLQASREEG
jgi:Autographiviridae endonuclease VII